MTKPDDPRQLLVRDALDAYKEEYRELSETWRSLDAKAQGTIAISGIFLAGMLAFVRTLTQTTCPTEKCSLTAIACPTEKWLLTATAVFLAFSIILSLLALWIRAVLIPPRGESLGILINDLLESKDGTAPERLMNYCRDQARMWRTTNEDVAKVNKTKAGHLVKAQVILFLAIGCAVIVTLMEVWN